MTSACHSISHVLPGSLVTHTATTVLCSKCAHSLTSYPHGLAWLCLPPLCLLWSEPLGPRLLSKWTEAIPAPWGEGSIPSSLGPARRDWLPSLAVSDT